MIARLAVLSAVWLLASAAQVSCSSGDTSTLPDPFPGSGNGATLTTTLVLRNAAGTATNRFARGDIIYFELTVRNSSRSYVTGFVGNSPADYLVYENPADAPSWRWGEGRNTTMEAYPISLLPGETKVFNVTWNQVTNAGAILTPGTYRARGTIQIIADTTTPLTADDVRSALKEFTVN